MRKLFIAAFALTALGCGLARAEQPAPDVPPPQMQDQGPPPGPDGGPFRAHVPGTEPGPGPRLQFEILRGPQQEVIRTALEIERLCREQGKPREVIALYQDLLARTKDPAVRSFAYEALARAEQQPSDPDKAIATLKQSLDESLQRLNQMPAPHGPEDGKAP
jgi:hypothetical protein